MGDPRVKPILFSGPMIRAILSGAKSQTRRILKPQPACQAVQYVEFCDGSTDWFAKPIDTIADEEPLRVPYRSGDLLWVRENGVQLGNAVDEGRERDGYEACGFLYYANDATIYLPGMFEGHDYERPRPSIHMPRWASRLTLEVEAVKVERLQDISREDEIAEGTPDGMFFDCLWDSINGKRTGCAWADNPWVCAVTFRTHHQNIDAYLAEREAA